MHQAERGAASDAALILRAAAMDGFLCVTQCRNLNMRESAESSFDLFAVLRV
jgi:hypothetical protein